MYDQLCMGVFSVSFTSDRVGWISLEALDRSRQAWAGVSSVYEYMCLEYCLLCCVYLPHTPCEYIYVITHTPLCTRPLPP